MSTETPRAPPGKSHRPPPDKSHRPPPDEASLRQAALNYLARFSTTEAGLRLVLHRRIDSWARQSADRDNVSECAAVAKAAVPGIVARMVELGLLNDAAFAESKARGLALNGRSRRAITARLSAKGINPARARAALPEDEESELVSALILTRKRRIGPYRTVAEDRNKELGVLARAGFPREVALRALNTTPEDAEAAISAARA
jgi:regulatory protein